MSINLTDFETQTRKAIIHFWQSRQEATEKQIKLGNQDQGRRGEVTGGKNMDGFIDIVKNVVLGNGLTEYDIFTKTKVTLPGFYRSTKNWDLLIVHQDKLVGAIELKSQAGSVGKNMNNRCEEALGSATDLLTAFREGAFGESPKPFLGYLMLVEDSEELYKTPKKDTSPHFKIFKEFRGATYAQRYEILCQKLVRERLYDAATLLIAKSKDSSNGEYKELSSITELRQFMAALASHVAQVAALEA